MWEATAVTGARGPGGMAELLLSHEGRSHYPPGLQGSKPVLNQDQAVYTQLPAPYPAPFITNAMLPQLSVIMFSPHSQSLNVGEVRSILWFSKEGVPSHE